MEEVWYLFKSNHYRIKNNEFIQHGSNRYYMYNVKTQAIYFGNTSLIKALKARGVYTGHHKSLFLDPIDEDVMVWFEACKSNCSLNKYSQVIQEVCKNLVNVEIGETFIDKLPTFRHYFYLDYKNLLKEHMDSVLKFKECVQINDFSSITDEDRSHFKSEFNWFLSVTLLYASHRKPTMEQIKNYYPEYLIY